MSLEEILLIRVDLNGPLSEYGGLIEHYRVWVYANSLNFYGKGKIVLMTHQGKGEPKDISGYARIMSRISGRRIGYSEEAFGEEVLRALDNYSILLLPNLRAYKWERLDSLEKMLNCEFVAFWKSLEGILYVNDAFSVSHRFNTSVVAFPYVIPSKMGPNFKKEYKILKKIEETLKEGKVLLILGGTKKDKIKYTQEILGRFKNVDVFLTGLQAVRYIQRDDFVCNALRDFGERIYLPKDFVYFGGKPVDIGRKTIEILIQMQENYKYIIIAGAPGIFELGHKNIIGFLENVEKRKIIIFGGHTSDMIYEERKLFEKIISSGGKILMSGGAALAYLAGEELPGLIAIRRGPLHHKSV